MFEYAGGNLLHFGGSWLRFHSAAFRVAADTRVQAVYSMTIKKKRRLDLGSFIFRWDDSNLRETIT